jgi:hypothetical protein
MSSKHNTDIVRILSSGGSVQQDALSLLTTDTTLDTEMKAVGNAGESKRTVSGTPKAKKKKKKGIPSNEGGKAPLTVSTEAPEAERPVGSTQEGMKREIKSELTASLSQSPKMKILEGLLTQNTKSRLLKEDLASRAKMKIYRAVETNPDYQIYLESISNILTDVRVSLRSKSVTRESLEAALSAKSKGEKLIEPKQLLSVMGTLGVYLKPKEAAKLTQHFQYTIMNNSDSVNVKSLVRYVFSNEGSDNECRAIVGTLISLESEKVQRLLASSKDYDGSDIRLAPSLRSLAEKSLREELENGTKSLPFCYSHYLHHISYIYINYSLNTRSIVQVFRRFDFDFRDS